jgi:hypothetical protein
MAFREGIANAEPRVLMYSMDADYHICSLLTTEVPERRMIGFPAIPFV